MSAKAVVESSLTARKLRLASTFYVPYTSPKTQKNKDSGNLEQGLLNLIQDLIRRATTLAPREIDFLTF